MHTPQKHQLQQLQRADSPEAASSSASVSAAAAASMEARHSPLKQNASQQQRPVYEATKLQFIGLLLFALLFYIGVIAVAMTTGQYIYARYALEAGIPDAGRSSDSSKCKGHSNATEDLRRRAAIAQQRSSELGLYNSLAGGIPSLFSVFLLSAFSDRWGRKVSMLIPWTTTFLAYIVTALVVLLDLKLEWTLLANFILGLGGSYASMLAAVFATVADITTSANRALYIGIAEATLTVCFSFAEVSVGVWIRTRGFKEPTIAFTCMVATSLVPYLMLVPETAPTVAANHGQPMTQQRARQLLASSFNLFTGNWHRAKKLAAVLLAFFFFSLAAMAFGVSTLYVLGLPFCWNAEKLGYYLAAGSIADQIVFVLVLALLRSRVTDAFLHIIGVGSDVARYAVLGAAFLFAPPFDDLMLYFARVVGLLSKLPSTMMRAIMSKTVSSTEQGAAFGVVAFVQVVASLFAGTMTSAIYAATVASFPGFVFYVMAVFMACSGVCIAMYAKLNKDEQQQQTQCVSVNLDEQQLEDELADNYDDDNDQRFAARM